MDKISERDASPRNPFAIRYPKGNGAIGCSAARITVDPAAGIGVEVGWIGAKTRIAGVGMIAVTVLTVVAVVNATTAVDEMIVGAVATVGAITNSDVFLFSSIFPKTQYRTDVVSNGLRMPRV